jgi:peptidyl-prolyl cis-trans isomerase D
MAVIIKIRKKLGWLMVGVIAIAIAGFLVMDVDQDNSLFREDTTNIGSINGSVVPYQEYLELYNILEDRYRRQTGIPSINQEVTFLLRAQTWNELVDDVLLNEQYRELGILISSDEFNDMVLGPNPDPRVRQEFTDPQTGEFQREQLSNYLNTLKTNTDASLDENRYQWGYFAANLRKERVRDKYENLIKKGMYVPSWMAEEDFVAKNKRANIKYVKIPFSGIPDSTVKVSDGDLRSYLGDNPGKYEQEASRSVDFISWPISASEEDSLAVYEWVAGKREDLIASDNDSLYISLHSDFGFNPNYFTLEEMEGLHTDSIFSMDTGTVLGPYYEEGTFRLAKLSDRKMVPDSVRARQIYINVNSQETFIAVNDLMDSLKILLEEGTATFEELVQKHSQDQLTLDSQGDMGWVMRGEEFSTVNEKLFFSGEQGGLYKVIGERGFHLIEILESTPAVEAVQVGYVVRSIEASKKTRDLIYKKAVEFVGKNQTSELFEAAVEEDPDLLIRNAPEVLENDYNVIGLGFGRELIRWAFEADLNDVSEQVFDLEDKFVVGRVAGVKEKGVATVENVRTELETNAIKVLKAKQIRAQLEDAAGESIDDYAAAVDQQVESATFITFSSTFIPGIGNEPSVVGGIFGLQPGDAPVIVDGSTGVYVIIVETYEDPGDAGDLSIYINQLSQPLESNVEKELMNSLKELADIEDRRSIFY